MLSKDEISRDKDTAKYQLAVFLWFGGTEDCPKYDFRCKSIDTALDLVIGLASRPAYKNQSYELSISIGVLYWSQNGNTNRIEDDVRLCLDLTNWQIEGVDL